MRRTVVGVVVALLVVLLAAVGSVSWAQEGPVVPGAAAVPAVPALPPLDAVRWAGPAISYDMLKGKTAVVLVYATWCPKCNAWSGELFKQLREAASNAPAVILAINADETPGAAKQYVTERGLFGPNIFHGYDPAMHRKMGFDSNLFNYVIVGPDGAVAGRGFAGTYAGGDEAKRFTLAGRLAGPDVGEFQFISPGMSDALKALFWPWELGSISESALKAAQGRLSAEEKKEAEAAVAKYLDGKLDAIRAKYKGTVPERIEAYEAALALSGVFRGTAQNAKAKEVVKFLEADATLKHELAAKKVYDGAMQKIAENPKRKAALLKAVVQRFEDTHYGKLAAAALEGEGP